MARSSLGVSFLAKSNSNKSSSPITEAEEKSMTMKPLNNRNNPFVRTIGETLYKTLNKTGDITFQVQGEEIIAHKCVLAALSPKYMAELYSDFEEAKKATFPVKDVSAAAFKEFLQFFYLDRVTLTHENIGDVLALTAQSSENFFKECVQFLSETLSIDNVCQIYHLAVMHNMEDLIDCCEWKIMEHSKEIFHTDGFLSCTHGDLFNILQSDYLSCKEVDVFEACIKWAKQKCTETDPNRVENLRKVLTGDDVLEGKLLYQIRFGSMTIEEFMQIYSSYKDLFTESEREEILLMIGKVSDSIQKRFNGEQRDIRKKKWDPTDCAEGDRIIAAGTGTESEVFRLDANKTLLSTDYPILLGGFYCGSLLKTNSGAASVTAAREKSVTTNISIIRKHRLCDADGKTLLNTTEKLTFKTDHQTYVNLEDPIILEPNFFYEIQLVFKEGISLKSYNLKNQLFLGNGVEFTPSNSSQSSTPLEINFTIITFHSCSSDLVTSLMFNLISCPTKNKKEID